MGVPSICTPADEAVAALIARGRTAAAAIAPYGQTAIDDLCLAVGWASYGDANVLLMADTAVAETGMGNIADKIEKHKIKVLGTLRDIKGVRSVGLVESDPERGLRKYAKPVGVVGAITPVTHPTSTLACKTISILKGGNAVVFSPHPRARRCCRLFCILAREALSRIGAPTDLVQSVDPPSVELARELMRQADVVVATGGAKMVRAAYSSGRPAYGVGAGNPVAIVAPDADLDDAAAKIVRSKTFDHGISCSAENSIAAHDSIDASLRKKLGGLGVWFCDSGQRAALLSRMWPGPAGELDPALVGMAASRLAAAAGFAVPENTSFLAVEGNPAGDRFDGEKLSPVMAMWRYCEFDEALALVDRLTTTAGMGHSCGIHTFNESLVERLAASAKTSRIMVRQPQSLANGGSFTNGMPFSLTLGCGSWGGNITSDNVNWRHFINITTVSTPTPQRQPSEEEIWGEFHRRKRQSQRGK